MTMCRDYESPKVSEIVVLGIFWAPMFGRMSVNSHSILKIRTVLESGLHYLQFSTILFVMKFQICGFLGSKFVGFWAPNLYPISQRKMKMGVETNTNLKALKNSIRIYQKQPFHLPRKRWSPLNFAYAYCMYICSTHVGNAKSISFRSCMFQNGACLKFTY